MPVLGHRDHATTHGEPGWLNLGDLAHFPRVLAAQNADGLRGDLPEIGCLHSRSARVLARRLRTGERLILADGFDLPSAEACGDTPNPKRVWRNPEDRIEIGRCYSRELHQAPEIRPRFASVDGGDDAETMQTGLALCAERTVPGR